MERAAALKKITKILGNKFGYRVDRKAPDQDERDEAKAKLPDMTRKRNDLRKQMDARQNALLQADAEYQRLKSAYAEANNEYDNVRRNTNRYRFSVGKTEGIFYWVKAEGDSWEEVIEKLKRDKAHNGGTNDEEKQASELGEANHHRNRHRQQAC